MGEAVAFELQKEYAKELQPQAPKLTVPAPLYHMEEEDVSGPLPCTEIRRR